MPLTFPSSVAKRVRLALLHKCNSSRKRRDEITVVDYSHGNLSCVPEDILLYENTLEELHLEANCLQELPKWLFQCHALRHLILSDNELDCLPPSISSLTSLERIDLSRNDLISLPDNIRYCKQLTSVDCSSNRLERLCEGLTMLVNLKELYLNDTLLEFLPGNFGRLTELKILEMRATRMRLLPVTLPKLTKLERLDFGANSFIEFPNVLTNLPSLQELWLDSNRLISIDNSIDKLTNLTFLDISQNQLTELPNSIGHCKLTDLHVSDNFLITLPESIANLTTLQILTANNNQIEHLPSAIGNMISLVELHLSFNNITAIPTSLGLLHNLQFLALDHNQIQSIPTSIGSCSSLSVLSLRSNCLTQLPDEIGRLSLLKVLNVSGNLLQYLPFNLLKLKNLQALWMNENQAKPLIAFEQDRHPSTGQRVLTCILLPQTDASMNRYTSKNRFVAEQTIDYSDRLTTLRFANDTIDEPRQLIRNPTPYPKEMRAFANILRNYNHNHHRQLIPSPKKNSSSNLLMVCEDIPVEQAWCERTNSASAASMNSDPLCCPLARSHEDLLCNISPVGDMGQIRPDLLPGQINDLDEVKNRKNSRSPIMNSSKAEAENIEPSAGKEMLEKYWAEIKNEIDDINIVEFRTTDLPLARIKKIMKLDDDVKMISAEVPILFAKAAELFIQELTIHSWLQTEESRRRTLQRNDVAAAISKNELFDFLIDIVPREEATKTHKKKESVSEVQYIVTLPTSGGMGNTIQLPNGQIIQLPQNLSSNIVTMASPQGTQQQYTIGP